jgi:hypothetical protein
VELEGGRFVERFGSRHFRVFHRVCVLAEPGSCGGAAPGRRRSGKVGRHLNATRHGRVDESGDVGLPHLELGGELGRLYAHQLDEPHPRRLHPIRVLHQRPVVEINSQLQRILEFTEASQNSAKKE